DRGPLALRRVVVPMFREGEAAPVLLPGREAVLGGLGVPYRVVVVDDGSRDRPRQRLQESTALGDRMTIVCLSRNFGLEAAIEAGLRHAPGEGIVLLDAAFPETPGVIPPLLGASAAHAGG